MAIAPPKPWQTQSPPLDSPPSKVSSAPLPPTVDFPSSDVHPLTPLGSSLNANHPYSTRFDSFGSYGPLGGPSMLGGYSRFGGIGSYNSLAGYGGYGGYGPPMYPRSGAFATPNHPMTGLATHHDPAISQPSLSQTLAHSTQSTFQLLESFVMAFSGFSQLLESTLMMTHSSFFTLIQLIEQFNLFKFSIAKILSLFDLIKWLKGLITGKEASGSSSSPFSSWSNSFRQLHKSTPSGSAPLAPRPSRKPIIFFFLTVFGIPYLMNKFIRSVAARQRASSPAADPDLDCQKQVTLALDPSKLMFVKAVHPYRPTDQQAPGQLGFAADEIIAVISPSTEREREEAGWWKGRLRNGSMGWFPKNYVKPISYLSNNNSNSSPTSAPITPASSLKSIPQKDQPLPLLSDHHDLDAKSPLADLKPQIHRPQMIKS